MEKKGDRYREIEVGIPDCSKRCIILYVLKNLQSSLFWDTILCCLLKVNILKEHILTTCSMQLSCLASCCSEMSTEFQHTWWPYIQEDRILHNHLDKSLRSYKNYSLFTNSQIPTFDSLYLTVSAVQRITAIWTEWVCFSLPVTGSKTGICCQSTLPFFICAHQRPVCFNLGIPWFIREDCFRFALKETESISILLWEFNISFQRHHCDTPVIIWTKVKQNVYYGNGSQSSNLQESDVACQQQHNMKWKHYNRFLLEN